MICKIIKYYEDLPETGLYEKISESEKINKFTEFLKYFKSSTKDMEDVVNLKKKIELEKKKLTETMEYKHLLQKINNIGMKYKIIGEDFEKKSFNNLKNRIKFIYKDIPINKNNLKIYKNKTLYYQNEKKEWVVIGEIDAVLIYKKDNINYIFGLCEIKNNFDDIPDALFQIKRSYDMIKLKNSNNVRLDDIILDDTFRLYYNDYLETSLIITSFDTESNRYFNIQSKLKHMMIMFVNVYMIKPNKLLKKIYKKQKIKDKFSNKMIMRYSKDVLYTLKLLVKNKMENRLIVI